MTARDFRNLARKLPGVVESAHMNHPDFRVGGKIFATLGFPDEQWGMVKLSTERQSALVEQAPRVFKPCNGAWGRGGATNVHLALASKGLLQAALAEAFKLTSSPAKRQPRAVRKPKP